jgi:hypothetical protein
VSSEWKVPFPPRRCVNACPHFQIQFADGNIKLFIETKIRTMHAVEALYGDHTADSISKNATLAQALLSCRREPPSSIL